MAPSILFFGKADDFHCNLAADFLRLNCPDAIIRQGKKGDQFPEVSLDWQGDLLVSYLSPWIIPADLLKRPSIAAINFHPGPSEYPGIGCTNFAIYEEADVFGITCHHMLEKVDTGEIIIEKRFPLYNTDTVLSLTQRCYAHILAVFYDVMARIFEGSPLPAPAITWKREAFTRKELNELCRLSLEMDEKEINRRIRAVTFPNAPGAYFEIGDQIHKVGW